MTTPDNPDRFYDELEALTRGNVGDRALGYLSLMESDDYLGRLGESWHTIQEPAFSTPAFHATVLPPAGTTMRISFQEVNYVRHTLSLYTRQLGGLPFKVLGYYNWPDGAPRGEVNATRHVLHTFIKDHPEVPFAFFEGEMEQPMTPSKLSRLVSSALLPLIHSDGLILSHDADFVSLSAGHFDALHRPFLENKPPSATVPRFSHASIPSLPRMNHLIQWIDDQEAAELRSSYYEPGPAVTVDDYIAVNGYDPDVRVAETHDLITRIQGHRNPITYWEWAHDAHIVGSPRRFIQAFAQRNSVTKIWTPTNFLPTDDYRTLSLTDLVRSVEDLPEAEYLTQLRMLGAQHMALSTYHLAAIGTEKADAVAFARLEQIRARLGGPDDMFARTHLQPS